MSDGGPTKILIKRLASDLTHDVPERQQRDFDEFHVLHCKREVAPAFAQRAAHTILPITTIHHRIDTSFSQSQWHL